ncbi:MAG: phosphoglycerate mutase family protein [Egibacteraceae bacterium]
MTERTRLELVRHAQALARKDWRGRDDHQRPLTEVGHHQAAKLAEELAADEGVAAAYTSPYVRCQQTLGPFAERAGLRVVDEDALGEAPTVAVHDDGEAWVTAAWLGGRALAFCDLVTSEHSGARVVACSHGDVIPALLAALAGRDGLELADVHLDKGGRCTLTFDGARCVGVTVLSAPQTETAET